MSPCRVGAALCTPLPPLTQCCPTVSPEDRERYTEAIDSILVKSDLNTISEKRIRTGVQEVVGYDLTPQKVRSASPLSQIYLGHDAGLPVRQTHANIACRLRSSS